MKKGANFCWPLFSYDLAGPKGLEPSPSGVTGRRYNQLNYDPALKLLKPTLLFFPWAASHRLFMVGGTGLEPVTSTV